MIISRTIITYIVTFIFFMLESITNYNLGKIEGEKTSYNLQYIQHLFKLPPYDDLFKIVLSVGFFSLLSSCTMKLIDNFYS